LCAGVEKLMYVQYVHGFSIGLSKIKISWQSAASYPPLQKAQERGTHFCFLYRQSQKGRPPALGRDFVSRWGGLGSVLGFPSSLKKQRKGYQPPANRILRQRMLQELRRA
jgi:hypothetical protein